MNKQLTDLSPLLTAKDAAVRLKVSLSWLAKARMRGDGPPYICVGRSIRYAEAAHPVDEVTAAPVHQPAITGERRDPDPGAPKRRLIRPKY